MYDRFNFLRNDIIYKKYRCSKIIIVIIKKGILKRITNPSNIYLKIQR